MNNKMLSVKIDRTIEGFLLFVIRYFVTILHILRHPLSPQLILNKSADNPAVFVQPLTFLAIGAFVFSLLIGVYPAGFSGMLDLIWFVDELKQSVRNNWQYAISVTSLITTGMPVIFTITGISALIGKLLFRDAGIRSIWFKANCYAFGFQSITLFFVFSLDSVVYATVAMFPFLENIKIDEGFANPIMIALLLSVVVVSIVWPVLFVCASLIKLKLINKPKVSQIYWLIGVIYCFGIQYLYAGAASVLPNLEKRFFTEEKIQPSMEVVRVEGGQYVKSQDDFFFVTEIIVDNNLDHSLIVDIVNDEFLLSFNSDDCDPLADERCLNSVVNEFSVPWYIKQNNIELLDPVGNSKIIVIKAGEVGKFTIKLGVTNFKNIYCEVLNIENSQSINTNSLNQLVLKYSGYRSSIEISHPIDLYELLETLSNQDEVNKIKC